MLTEYVWLRNQTTVPFSVCRKPVLLSRSGSHPIENAKVISIFSPDQEKAFLEACDNWQFSVFLTLMLTGLRPGELTHLLLPDDLNAGMLYVRNKPPLSLQVKTRNEREIPLIKLRHFTRPLTHESWSRHLTLI